MTLTSKPTLSIPVDALALAERVRRGVTTATALMQASLQRAHELQALGAIRWRDENLGLAAAAAADRGGVAGAFAGIPFLMKDLGAVAAGLPLTAGSRALAARTGPARHDSDLAGRFRRAGLIPFGTTTVPEFGLALVSEPALGPIARNPFDQARTPGGSSGGAAAAVAAGIVALAHATDAGGSTRVPAACCGLIGLKPTRGAIPGGPDFGNLLNGLASELVVSRSLRDTAATLDAVAGAARGPAPDPALGPALAHLDRPPDPLRIGVVLDPPAGFALETARRAAVAHAAEVLARAGHHIVPLEDHALDPMAATAAMVFDRIISTNLAYGLGRLEPQLAQGEVEPLTAAVAARGRAMTTGDLIDAHLAAARLSHRMAAIFERCDVLLTPMLASAPLLLGSMPMDHDNVDLHWRRMQAFAPYVAIANAAGNPALAVPHGRDDAGLPLSVQLLGPMTSDALLLRLARQLESAEPWRFAAGIAGEDLAGEDLQ